MKKLLLTLPFLLFICTSCANKSLNVFIETTVEQQKSSPIIIGKTNLPDGTGLRPYLIHTNNRNIREWYVSDKIIIQNGQFKAGPFHLHEKKSIPVPKGEYELQISMIYDQDQSLPIQKIIGENGRNLAGRWVKTDSISGYFGRSTKEKIINYTKPITIY